MNNALITLNSYDSNAKSHLSETLQQLIKNEMAGKNEIVVLCIGTDRATGDSLGPLTGYKLKDSLLEFENVHIYGTLEYPIHAGNLTENIDTINNNHKNAVIIAIDASLGKLENVGYLFIGKGHLKPGTALKKNLPFIGHIYITGVVNYMGSFEMLVLQNTRLNIVMRLADLISASFLEALSGL